MSLRVSKPEFNIREKLNELDRPMGVQGNNILQSNTTAESFSKIQAGRRNLLINGDMTIAQRGSSTTSITTDTFGACDRWELDISSGGTWTMEQVGDAPYNTGFTHCLSLTCTTAHAMGGNPSFVQLRQKIEAGNIKALMGGTPNAKPLTVSFWVKSNEPGKYYVSLYRVRSGTDSSRMSLSYTIEQSEVWEFKTLTFPPDTMNGYQTTASSTGLEIQFNLGIDQNNYGSAHYGHWHTNNAYLGKGQTNLAAATSNYWRMTGAQIEIGNEHTEFEHRLYGEELALCQRYFWREYGGVYHYEPGPTNGAGVLGQGTHPVAMRTKPTMSHNCSGSSNGASVNGNNTVGVWTWYKQNSGFDSGHSSYQTVANWNFANSEKGIHWNGGSYNFRPSDKSGTTGINLGVNTYIQATAEL